MYTRKICIPVFISGHIEILLLPYICDTSNTIGMAVSQIIMWAIITTTAGSLHVHNITNIQTASEAAKALEPFVKSFPCASQITKTIFALGIIGTGLWQYQ